MRSVNENQKRSGKIQEESFVDEQVGEGRVRTHSSEGQRINVESLELATVEAGLAIVVAGQKC